MRLASLIIVGHWVYANASFYILGNAAVNFIAPLMIAILVGFYFLWRSPSLNGAFIHKIFFTYYFFYFLINIWHFLGRVLFPETFVATYWFSLAASNGVFILIVTTLWLFAILKFLDNNAEGGLMGVYERNIENWRRWFGGR